jgi:DNA-binding NarL/FixJ family response regulator
MTINVILADDHAVLRQGLAPLLEMEPDIALLAQAANGEEAWQQIESHQPDVAILDIGMPEMSGIEVAREVTAQGLDTRVVLLTMHEDPCAANDAQEAGAAGYVLKDSAFEELLLAVRTVAAGGTFVTPSIQAKLRELKRRGCTTVSLSPREREVIRLIALGNSSKEVARILDISPATVGTYRNRLMEKLALHTVADVVRYAVRAGMVD